MAEKRNIILFGSMILLTLSYWVSSSLLIGEKPFEIRLLEEEQQELNENLISAQILASQLDRVFTLFQENLALSKADSLADDASLPFLNNLTAYAPLLVVCSRSSCTIKIFASNGSTSLSPTPPDAANI